MAQTVKNLPAVQETWVLSLGWEDPPERGMATHPSILAWRIPRTEMVALVYRSWASAQHVQPPANPIRFRLNPTVWTASLANLSCYCLSWIHWFFCSDRTPSVCLKSEVKGDCQQPRTSVQFWMAGVSSNSRAWLYTCEPKCIAMPSPRLSNSWIYCVNTLHP